MKIIKYGIVMVIGYYIISTIFRLSISSYIAEAFGFAVPNTLFIMTSYLKPWIVLIAIFLLGYFLVKFIRLTLKTTRIKKPVKSF